MVEPRTEHVEVEVLLGGAGDVGRLAGVAARVGDVRATQPQLPARVEQPQPVRVPAQQLRRVLRRSAQQHQGVFAN